MEIYIALLRGINVSGQKIIRMKDLVKMFQDIGFANVQTYVQSGNVVFQYKKESKGELEILIHEGILNYFGFDVSVLVLTVSIFESIISNNPFKIDSSNNTSYFYITFLASPPVNYDLNAIRGKKAENEEIKITDDAAYLFCPNGYGKTKLNNTFLEKQLGVKATTRNWKTTLKLQEVSRKM